MRRILEVVALRNRDVHAQRASEAGRFLGERKYVGVWFYRRAKISRRKRCCRRESRKAISIR
jgi:hypothetical protein